MGGRSKPFSNNVDDVRNLYEMKFYKQYVLRRVEPISQAPDLAKDAKSAKAGNVVVIASFDRR
jgi:hypothetical protein